METGRAWWKVLVSLIFSVTATVLFILIAYKLLAYFAPFVVGWVISLIIHPLVSWLEKNLKIAKSWGSAITVVVVLALFVLLIYALISIAANQISSFISDFPGIYGSLRSGFGQIGENLSGVYERLPENVQTGWTSIIEKLNDLGGTLVSSISTPTITVAGNVAKRIPYYIICFFVIILSAYFFTVQREGISAWLSKIAPESVNVRMKMVGDYLVHAVGGYFKAQFKIMGVVFLILLVGLGLLRIRYFGLIAFLTSFLDFLPFFGTGTVMIPWALYHVFLGHYRKALLLAIIYVISQSVRQSIQPKLLGDSVGLDPLITLALLFVGYRLGGFLWMILAVPLGMVFINMVQAGAFTYITDDVKILTKLILSLREEPKNPADTREAGDGEKVTDTPEEKEGEKKAADSPEVGKS